MFALDERTIERIARLIADVGGPYERTGSEIERLLHRVRWPGQPEYDGTPRVPWLTDVLTAHAEDTSAVDRLLCRVCDPLEYDGGSAEAELVAETLNQILSPEQLSVTYVGGRPVLERIDQANDAPQYGQPPDLPLRLQRLAPDHKAVAILIARAEEATICQRNGAHALAIIGIGSFAEGLLHIALTEHDQEVKDRGLVDAKGRRVSADRAGLHLLLDYAHRKQWIATDAKDFMDKVRDYRNFVHPRHQIQYGLVPDEDTVQLCWAPVHALLNDLEAALL